MRLFAKSSGMEQRLTIEIKNQSPLGLTDLTMSMLGVHDQFSRFLDRNGIEYDQNKSALYVKELRSGSVIIDLAPYVAFALPLIQDFNTVTEFTKYLRSSFDYFLGKNVDAPISYTRKDIEQLSRCVNVAANDAGSQVNFIAHSGAKQEIHFHLTSIEANAAQNQMRKHMDLLGDPESNIHRKVLLHWHQARFKDEQQTGDRGVIESISDRPIKIVFIDAQTKRDMISHVKGSKPWQELAYVVDVRVEMLNKRPRLYTITDFYPDETFDPDEG